MALQQSINRCRTAPEYSRPHLRIKAQVAIALHRIQEFRQDHLQALAADAISCLLHYNQCLVNDLVMHAAANISISNSINSSIVGFAEKTNPILR